jgi:hypothetical protein
MKPEFKADYGLWCKNIDILTSDRLSKLAQLLNYSKINELYIQTNFHFAELTPTIGFFVSAKLEVFTVPACKASFPIWL